MKGLQDSWLGRFRALFLALGLLVIWACGGSGNLLSTWRVVTGGTNPLIAPGATGIATLNLQNLSTGISYVITGTPGPDAPPGWTVTFPSTVSLPRNSTSTVAMQIQISVPAGTPSGVRSFTVALSDGQGQIYNPAIVVTVGGSGAITSIQKTIDFANRFDGVYESGLKVTNGEAFPITTLIEYRPLGFVSDTDAIVWYRTKAGGISVDPGDEESKVCNLLPRTNLSSRFFSLEHFIYASAVEYKYSDSLVADAATSVGYNITAIDWLMGVSMADPDKTTTYSVDFDQVVTNKAGQYTFTVTGLDTTQYSASINPATAPVNSNGDPVSVSVEITRIGAGTGETVDEFTLVATHSNAGDMNSRLRLPIRTYVGR